MRRRQNNSSTTKQRNDETWFRAGSARARTVGDWCCPLHGPSKNRFIHCVVQVLVTSISPGADAGRCIERKARGRIFGRGEGARRRFFFFFLPSRSPPRRKERAYAFDTSKQTVVPMAYGNTPNPYSFSTGTYLTKRCERNPSVLVCEQIRRGIRRSPTFARHLLGVFLFWCLGLIPVPVARKRRPHQLTESRETTRKKITVPSHGRARKNGVTGVRDARPRPTRTRCPCPSHVTTNPDTKRLDTSSNSPPLSKTSKIWLAMFSLIGRVVGSWRAMNDFPASCGDTSAVPPSSLGNFGDVMKSGTTEEREEFDKKKQDRVTV